MCVFGGVCRCANLGTLVNGNIPGYIPYEGVPTTIDHRGDRFVLNTFEPSDRMHVAVALTPLCVDRRARQDAGLLLCLPLVMKTLFSIFILWRMGI